MGMTPLWCVLALSAADMPGFIVARWVAVVFAYRRCGRLNEAHRRGEPFGTLGPRLSRDIHRGALIVSLLILVGEAGGEALPGLQDLQPSCTLRSLDALTELFGGSTTREAR